MAQQLGLRGSGCLACGGTPRVLGRMREGVTMGGCSVLLKGLAAPDPAGSGNNEGGLKANGKRTDFSPLTFGKCLYFICGGRDRFAKLIRSLLSTGVSICHPGPFLWPQAADSTGQCVHPTPCSSPRIPPPALLSCLFWQHR